jgi:hypothetical protein
MMPGRPTPPVGAHAFPFCKKDEVLREAAARLARL